MAADISHCRLHTLGYYNTLEDGNTSCAHLSYYNKLQDGNTVAHILHLAHHFYARVEDTIRSKLDICFSKCACCHRCHVNAGGCTRVSLRPPLPLICFMSSTVGCRAAFGSDGDGSSSPADSAGAASVSAAGSVAFARASCCRPATILVCNASRCALSAVASFSKLHSVWQSA
eukprot:SAG31_NODE_10802_length_1095_cov_4.798193_1_plen_173_part_00